MRRLVMACTVCQPPWRRPAPSPPRRHPARTSCWSPSTRCAPTGSAPTATRARTPTWTRSPQRRAVRRCHGPRAADVSVARLDPYRALPRCLRRPAQRHGSAARLRVHACGTPERAATVPARSSAASSWTRLRAVTGFRRLRRRDRRRPRATMAMADLQRTAGR